MEGNALINQENELFIKKIRLEKMPGGHLIQYVLKAGLPSKLD